MPNQWRSCKNTWPICLWDSHSELTGSEGKSVRVSWMKTIFINACHGTKPTTSWLGTSLQIQSTAPDWLANNGIMFSLTHWSPSQQPTQHTRTHWHILPLKIIMWNSTLYCWSKTPENIHIDCKVPEVHVRKTAGQECHWWTWKVKEKTSDWGLWFQSWRNHSWYFASWKTDLWQGWTWTTGTLLIASLVMELSTSKTPQHSQIWWLKWSKTMHFLHHNWRGLCK